jgi:hypothetical protein
MRRENAAPHVFPGRVTRLLTVCETNVRCAAAGSYARSRLLPPIQIQQPARNTGLPVNVSRSLRGALEGIQRGIASETAIG